MREVISWEEGRRVNRVSSFSHEEDLYPNTSSDHLFEEDGQKLELILIRVLEISS